MPTFQSVSNPPYRSVTIHIPTSQWHMLLQSVSNIYCANQSVTLTILITYFILFMLNCAWIFFIYRTGDGETTQRTIPRYASQGNSHSHPNEGHRVIILIKGSKAYVFGKCTYYFIIQLNRKCSWNLLQSFPKIGCGNAF